MTMLFYSLLLTLALVLSTPWWLLRMLTTERYREGLSQRLGGVPAYLRSFAQGKRIVWLHAVSVGEVLAATRLVAELEAALQDGSGGNTRIVVSTTTRTGQALARERFGVERVFYMPLDFAFATRRYLNALKPAALVLMESELWPRLLHECSARKIPVAVANARMSDRSFARAKKFRRLWSRMASRVTLFLAQSEPDAQRLIALGATKPNVIVTGNLKYDIRAPRQSRAAELVRSAANGRMIVVGGSTLDDKSASEDSWLIRSFDLQPGSNSPLLVLAPRHPQNFDLVYSMAIEYPTLRMTELLDGKTGHDGFSVLLREKVRSEVKILLLDTIGDLAAVYGIANVAFVGGTLVKRGGHNPLEPAQFGVPVVIGPSYENFRDIVTKMLDADAIRIVKDGYELADAMNHLLTNPAEARALGERGRAVFESQSGATARTVSAILQMIGAAQ